MAIPLIAGALALLVLIFFLLRKKSSPVHAVASAKTSASAAGSKPVSFGYKCLWFAIKTTDKKKVADILQLKKTTACEWKTGIDKAYTGAVYITPAVAGWTLACGMGLPMGDSEDSFSEVKRLLQQFSRLYGEAQFFATHRVVDFHCWMKAVNGELVRAYSFLGESGENIAVEGKPTAFEETLNLINTFSPEAAGENYFSQKGLRYPDEDLVMQIAASWSVDPTTIEERSDIEPGPGLLGTR